MRKINLIVVHCTATPEGRDVTVADIDKMHRAKGWKSIGYHYVIYRDGSVHQGRPVSEVGAHVYGHNANSIGVAYVGGLSADGSRPEDTRTVAQKRALRALISDLLKRYPKALVVGHCDLDPMKPDCPGFPIKDL